MAKRFYESVDATDTTIEETAMVVADDDDADHNIEALIGEKGQDQQQ